MNRLSLINIKMYAKLPTRKVIRQKTSRVQFVTDSSTNLRPAPTAATIFTALHVLTDWTEKNAQCVRWVSS